MAIQIDGDTGVSGVNGSATTPALQGTDSNTGIVFGTDTVQVATGGSTRATVGSAGNVSIGTATNTNKLRVHEGSDSANIILATGADESSEFISLGIDSGVPTVTAGGVSSTSASLAFRTSDSGTESERMRLDPSGRLLIGTTSAREHLNDGSDSAQVFVQGTTQNTSTLAVIRSSNNDGPSHIVLGKARGTGTGSTTVVQSGDTIGHINFEAADGSHLIRAGQISCVVDGTPGANDMPGSLRFSTCPNGSNSLIRRMQISNQGRVDIFATNLTDAHFISSAAGAGTSTDLITGKHSAGSIGAGTGCFAVKTNGNVVNTNNSYGSISDVKLKENIADASSQWDDLKAIQVRNYNFKEETGNPTHTQIGVVAQEVETVSPGLVYETPDRDSEGTDLGTVTKSVNYSVLYMKAVKALQEAQTRIETLETQHADLLARVTALEAA
jgi:hypothetical protein